jgi:hypothetical protein
MIEWDTLRGRYRVAADPLRSERKVELAALVLGLLLCLQLLYSGARLVMDPAFAAVAPAADVLQVKRVDSPATVATSQSDEIRSRPLFWQTRRPIQSRAIAPDTGSKQAGPLKEVKLLGVFGSGDTAGIIVLVKDKKQRILQGESVQGWTLDVVEPNRVVLVDGGRRAELVLKTRIVVAAADTGAVDTSQGESVTDNKKPASKNAMGDNSAGKNGSGKKATGNGAPAAKGGVRRLSSGAQPGAAVSGRK